MARPFHEPSTNFDGAVGCNDHKSPKFRLNQSGCQFSTFSRAPPVIWVSTSTGGWPAQGLGTASFSEPESDISEGAGETAIHQNKIRRRCGDTRGPVKGIQDVQWQPLEINNTWLWALLNWFNTFGECIEKSPPEDIHWKLNV